MTSGVGSSENSVRQYAIFLSYRHADNRETGRQWATWLHQTLEGYEIPADLVGSRDPGGNLIPPNLYPVFRDEEELPADADLTRNIRRALENSRLLVVLCSPRAVESRFVADEIRYFKELGKADRILALLIDGEPNASEDKGKAKRGIEPGMECLPLPLRYGAPDSSGRIDWQQRAEPIAADVRPEGKPEQGWTTGSAYREALETIGELGNTEITRKVREYEQQLELAKLKMVAGSLGLPLGVLTKRDKAMQLLKSRQRTKVLRRWLGALAVLASIAVIGGFYAWFQRREAIQQRDLVQLRETEQRRLLHDASMSDYGVAVQRIEKEQKWHEGVVHLARALDLDPENKLAAMLLYGTISQRADSQRNWPLRIIRPGAPVNDATFSPDGTSIATASDDRAVRIWNATSGEQSGTPLMHKSEVEKVSFSSDGTKLLTISGPKSVERTTGRFPPAAAVQLWDVSSRKALGQPILAGNSLTSAVFTRDGLRVITKTGDGQLEESGIVQVWDASTGKAVTGAMPIALRRNNDVPISRDQTKLAVWEGDNAVRLYSIASGAAIGPPLQHDAPINDAQFCGDGSKVITSSADGTARVWDTATGSLLGQPLRHPGVVVTALPNENGSKVLTISRVAKPVEDELESSAQLWDAETGRPVSASIGLKSKDDLGSALMPDGQQILVNNKLSPLIVDANTGKLLSTLDGVWLLDIRFSPDGSRFISTIESGADSALWSKGDKPLASNIPWSRDVYGLGFSEDSSKIIGFRNASVVTYDAASGAVIGSPITFENAIHSAKLSANGAQILVTSAEDAVYVFESPRLPNYGETLVHPGANNAQFSPEGTKILSAKISRDSITTARIWDALTHNLLLKVEERLLGLNDFKFNPSGECVFALLATKKVGIWNCRTAQRIEQPITHAAGIISAAFSHDSKRVITASSTGVLQIWDGATGQPEGEPFLRQEGVFAAAFSPDGTKVATTSVDNTVQLWTVDTKKPHGHSLKHDLPVINALFSPNGAAIVTLCGKLYDSSHYARVWNTTDGAPLGGPIPVEQTLREILFTHDGSKFVVNGPDYKPQLWSIPACVRDKSFGTAHGDGLSKIASFTPDDSVVAIADGSASRLQHVSTGKTLGERLHHGEDEYIYTVALSPNGARLATTSQDANKVCTTEIHNQLNPAMPVPLWVRDWARAVAGFEFDADGDLHSIPNLKRLSILTRRVEGQQCWDRLARWLVSTTDDRTVTPDSRFSIRQLAEIDLETGTSKGIDQALRRDPRLPLARLLLAGASKENSYRAAFLREYDLSRLPNDATLWARASELLMKQRLQPEALSAARKAVALDSASPVARAALANALEATVKSKR